MENRCPLLYTLLTAAVCAAAPMDARADRKPGEPVSGWLNWRGLAQNGTSGQTGLPDAVDLTEDGNLLWSRDLAGRGTPVIARYADGDRVFAWGYRGEKENFQEILVCLDAGTGRILWEHAFTDFISDIIYNRYAIGSPAVDPESGNVYLQTTPGLLLGFDRDGNELWRRSMMEQFGRLTFPNGRTGAPAIDGDLVIVTAITTNWGREGPARNRFYAFDKHSGDLVWSSTPGVGPPFLKDSSFSSPFFAWRGGKRVFYAGTGCGNVVCVNARTGEPIWRYQLAIGGVNSSIVLHGDTAIAIHGKENTDDTGRGRMVAIRIGAEPADGEPGPAVLDESHEVWRNDELSMFTSSPVIYGDRIYQVTAMGNLVCVDANTGAIVWHEKLGSDQLHASPLLADGKLYIPMWHDGLYIIEPTDDGPNILQQIELEGACIGSPAAWNGRVYLHTTKKLYCFGNADAQTTASTPPNSMIVDSPEPATPQSQLQIIPNEILLRPGGEQAFEVRHLDRNGLILGHDDAGGYVWSKWIPPTAKVKVKLNAEFDRERNLLVAADDATCSAGAFQAQVYGITGTFRGRILPSPPYGEDFESFDLGHTDKTDGGQFAYPPLPWIGARLKWQVRDLDGNKVLAKTLDRVLFMRSMVFIGHADDSNYTLAADVMTDGNRRGMSTVGLVNQKFIIALIGNAQLLEVSSNHERVKVSVPFSWRPGTWYRLKTRVDGGPDGGSIVRAKAWKQADAEPEKWTIEAAVPHGHTQGSPGLFGFSPQSQFRVYIDNVEATPWEE